MPVLDDTNENDLGGQGPEWNIRIIVPEEFVGASINELQDRQGCVISMDIKDREITVVGTLPASEYEALAEWIGTVTMQRGRVELVSSGDPR